MMLHLGAQDIEGLVSTAGGIAAVEAVHLDLGLGLMEQPAPVALTSAADDAVFLPMTARSDRLGIALVKLMSDIPGNATRGLPTQRSTILVVSTTTGETIAVLDGAAITRQRTAAASAVATRYLANPDGHILGLIGAGNLAVEHVAAIAAVRPISRVVVWSRTAATTERFVDRVRAAGFGMPILAGASPEAVVRQADIVCTLTPSRDPILRGEWLRPGQHVNAVGAPPRPTHREIDGAAMARVRLVVDSAATALSKSGDVLLALDEGALAVDTRLLELGTVVAGLDAGRTRESDITLFNSVGIAAQDLALTAAVLEAARVEGVGTDVPTQRRTALSGRHA